MDDKAADQADAETTWWHLQDAYESALEIMDNGTLAQKIQEAKDAAAQLMHPDDKRRLPS